MEKAVKEKKEVQFTPEDTHKENKSLLSLGYEHRGSINTTHRSHYFYTEDAEGRSKEVGKICSGFWL